MKKENVQGTNLSTKEKQSPLQQSITNRIKCKNSRTRFSPKISLHVKERDQYLFKDVSRQTRRATGAQVMLCCWQREGINHRVVPTTSNHHQKRDAKKKNKNKKK